MIIDISKVINSINKEISEEVVIEMASFESRLGDFPILKKTPVTLTIANRENKQALMLKWQYRVAGVWKRFRHKSVSTLTKNFL